MNLNLPRGLLVVSSLFLLGRFLLPAIYGCFRPRCTLPLSAAALTATVLTANLGVSALLWSGQWALGVSLFAVALSIFAWPDLLAEPLETPAAYEPLAARPRAGRPSPRLRRFPALPPSR